MDVIYEIHGTGSAIRVDYRIGGGMDHYFLAGSESRAEYVARNLACIGQALSQQEELDLVALYNSPLVDYTWHSDTALDIGDGLLFALTAHGPAIQNKVTTRPSWDSTFMSVAEAVAQRGTCNRGKVGAVIVSQSKKILATGYNGSLPGQAHCTDVGCEMHESHCVRTVHAEMNAIASAANSGTSVAGSILYSTHSPCLNCLRVALASGILTFRYKLMYRPNELVTKLIAKTPGATLEKVAS